MLRQRRRREERAMDAGGGHRPRLLHPAARPRELAVRAREHRFAAPTTLGLLLCSVDQIIVTEGMMYIYMLRVCTVLGFGFI